MLIRHGTHAQWSSGPALRLGLWLAVAIPASILVYNDSWALLVQVIANPLQVVDDHIVSSWGILALCLIGLVMKRKALASDLRTGAGSGRTHLIWRGAGLVCLALSAVFFQPAALLAGLTGSWLVVAGRAARWPLLLLGIYVIGSGFPLVANSVAAGAVEFATVTPTYDALQALGIPVSQAGALLTISDPAGQPVSVEVTSACAAPATIGVFLAIFALMVLDVPGPWVPTAALFIVGLAGTWIQNLGRLVFILSVGHSQGAPALWEAHADAGYPMFIAWFALFAAAYLWMAGRSRRHEAHPPRFPTAFA